MAYVKSVPESHEAVGTVVGRFPDSAIPLTEMTEVLMRTGECAFTPEQRELIAAYVSGTNACTFCFDTHRATAEAFGVEEGLLKSMLDDIDVAPVDETMKPVLRYARKLTLTPSKIVKDDVDAIFLAGWDEAAFHYTVMITGLFNFYNRIMDGYGVRNTAEFRQQRGEWLAESGYAWVLDRFRNPPAD